MREMRVTRLLMPMPESRLEERSLFCLDMEWERCDEARIKGCGTTCDVTEARADIQQT